MSKVADVGLLSIELPTDLYKRIIAAANWCRQTHEEFVKTAALGRLVEIEMAMQGEE